MLSSCTSDNDKEGGKPGLETKPDAAKTKEVNKAAAIPEEKAKRLFIERAKAAHASGSIKEIVKLYEPRMPAELKSIYRGKVYRVVKNPELTTVGILKVDAKADKYYNRVKDIKGKKYTFDPPITLTVRFKSKKKSISLPLVLHEDGYHLATPTPTEKDK